MRRSMQMIIIGSLTLAFLSYSPTANVAEPSLRRAKIIEIEGEGEVKGVDADVWKAAEVGMEVRSGDLIRVSKNSYVDISIEKGDLEDGIIRIKEDSTIKPDMFPSEIIIELIVGKVVFWAEKVGEELAKFEIRTPNTIIGVEGSQGVVNYEKESDRTESWLKVSGGYVVNIPSGKYERLARGANYVESMKEKAKVERELKKKIYSYDLKGFGRSYAFAKKMQAMRRGTTERYGKDYLYGDYRTSVGVSNGQVIVAPYDIDGPTLIKQIILYGGDRITIEGAIAFIRVGPPPTTSKREEEEEEDVELELDERLDESQEPVP